jgi:hypothetical protein
LNAGVSQWRPWVVVVGGLLGAGKTSLILAAVNILEKAGVRSAVVLNDQGEDLVDTSHVQLRGVASREVTGGCFCCRFSTLLSVMEGLRAYAPEVIFAEPTGSCADIAATVIRPLQDEFELCRVAPLTVLLDPARINLLIAAEANPNLAFLMRKQLEEADLVCISKADRNPCTAGIPGIDARLISAKTGVGIHEWLDEVLAGSLEAGTRTLEIDYERYAHAEAALAWLNVSFTVELASPAAPAAVAGPFLDDLDKALTEAGVSIVHLKLIDRSPAGWLKVAICANGGEPTVDGILDASPAHRHELLLNLRAIGSPPLVQSVVEGKIKCIAGAVLDQRISCFSPAPPIPERRRLIVRRSSGSHDAV